MRSQQRTHPHCCSLAKQQPLVSVASEDAARHENLASTVVAFGHVEWLCLMSVADSDDVVRLAANAENEAVVAAEMAKMMVGTVVDAEGKMVVYTALTVAAILVCIVDLAEGTLYFCLPFSPVELANGSDAVA